MASLGDMVSLNKLRRVSKSIQYGWKSVRHDIRGCGKFAVFMVIFPLPVMHYHLCY